VVLRTIHYVVCPFTPHQSLGLWPWFFTRLFLYIGCRSTILEDVRRQEPVFASGIDHIVPKKPLARKDVVAAPAPDGAQDEETARRMFLSPLVHYW
jgi:hypothetical protein